MHLWVEKFRFLFDVCLCEQHPEFGKNETRTSNVSQGERDQGHSIERYYLSLAQIEERNALNIPFLVCPLVLLAFHA